MTDEEVFEIIQVEGKPDEFKCKECERTFSVPGSVKRHVRAKHRKKDPGSTAMPLSIEEQLLDEENDIDDEFTFDAGDEEVSKSTQNGDKTLSAEEILKIYAEKDEEDEEVESIHEVANENENTLFPEKDVMLKLVTSSDSDKKNDAETETEETFEQIKVELEKAKNDIKEKDELLMSKDIEITTLKDEVESKEKEMCTKSEEMEILIASNNSLEEEKLSLKVKLLEESKKVEKVNNAMKRIFKEKEALVKENQNIKNGTRLSNVTNTHKQDEPKIEDLKKKMNERQKEIASLKEKNKKLADDLAEEQSKNADENPNNSLILTNLLKTRTAEMKRIDKEKEKIGKDFNESQSKLKEANDKLAVIENKNKRLETEVNNLVEILGKDDKETRGTHDKEEERQRFQRDGNTERQQFQMDGNTDRQQFQMDGNAKRCSFNNRATCRNTACRFIHSDFVCKSHSMFGKCDQGSQCQGRHPSGVCNRWRNGNCHISTEVCQFRHPEDMSKEGENKRKRSFESSVNDRKNAKVDTTNEDARNVFLCAKISDLHRKIEVYEIKERGNPSQHPQFNAPPAPPFTNYLPVPKDPQPIYSMVQTAGPATTSSFQPSGIFPAANQMPLYPANTSVWVPPPQQGSQWGGQGQVGRQGAGQPHHQEGLQAQVQYPGGPGPVFSQFYH